MPEGSRENSLDELFGASAGEASPTMGRLRELATTGREIAHLLLLTLRSVAYGERRPGAVLEQMYEIGNRSAVFLCVAMGFIGMIFVYQAGLQILRVIPDLTALGATFLEMLVRDLAASLSALLLATRVGAGIAAEIGSMVVTEQVDALHMCATDPVDYLVRPRFIACVFMTVALSIVAGCAAFLTGMWAAQAFFGINPSTFADFSLVDRGDAIVGLTKSIAYGAAIPVISAHSGLSTRGGSEGVGWATTRAVVSSSLAVVVLNFLISTAGYLVFG